MRLGGASSCRPAGDGEWRITCDDHGGQLEPSLRRVGEHFEHPR